MTRTFSFSLFLSLALALLSISNSNAQRGVTYENLLQRAEQPNIYTQFLSLPGTEDEVFFMTGFRMGYDLLPFRRVRSGQDRPGEETDFFSTARMSLEIFRGSVENRRRGFDPVTRSSWADTVWVQTFEQTRSSNDFLEGAMAVHLAPGEYSLFLDLNRDGTQRNARSRERTVKVPDFKTAEKGALVTLESSRVDDGQYQLRLLNFGENVVYGQDYQLFVLFPAEASGELYHLKIERLSASSSEQAEGEPLFEKEIRKDEFLFTDGFTPAPDSKRPDILFNSKEEGFAVFIADIPNSQFPSTRFRLSVTQDGEDEPVAVTAINSEWLDMPVSLLNLDVAIDMLRFILDEEHLSRMKRGSQSERERRFREFWAERDPTPDTEFNELMVEYYSRIDYAYNNFTTPQRSGYESDMGRTYILNGEPRRKERTLPPDGPTREIWYYGDRTLVFEATTGFGDFRLVRRQ